MPTSSIRATLPWPVRQVWDAVTAVNHYPLWRSDLERAEGRGEKRFAEYTGGGFSTAFTTTVWEPRARWEFDLENPSMQGHWTGIFIEKGPETEIILTEQVRVKRFYLRPVAKAYLRRQQARFVEDLRKFLAQQGGTG